MFKDGDFYAHSDGYLKRSSSWFPPEQVKDGSARMQLMRKATKLFDKRETPMLESTVTGSCVRYISVSFVVVRTSVVVIQR